MNALLAAGYSMSVTRALTTKDGTPVRSVRDFLARCCMYGEGGVA